MRYRKIVGDEIAITLKTIPLIWETKRSYRVVCSYYGVLCDMGGERKDEMAERKERAKSRKRKKREKNKDASEDREGP